MRENNNNDWPYPERRYPRPNNPDYLGSKGLSLGLQKAITLELDGKTNLKILDVGCGNKPFFPFFRHISREYIGTDLTVDNPMVDIVCPAEKLEIEDQWADVVLCLSVLEHVNDPIQSVKELYRVVKPGGVVLALTHGCFPWHPYPQDHWRWTQTGLKLMFEKHGCFKNVSIFAPLGSLSGSIIPISYYVYNWASQTTFRRFFRSALVTAINRFADFLDKQIPDLQDVNRHVTFLPELFVIAKRE